MSDSRRRYRVVATPHDDGYLLSVEGLGSFKVGDGSSGSLDDASRAFIARETGVPPNAVSVRLEHALMHRSRPRRSRVSGRIVLAGLAVFALAAAAIVLLSPVLAAVAGVSGLLLIAYRFTVDSDPPKV